MKFLDIKHELTEDFFMCLYAFGDKEDGTGFVRARDCPGKGSSRIGSHSDHRHDIKFSKDTYMKNQIKFG